MVVFTTIFYFKPYNNYNNVAFKTKLQLKTKHCIFNNNVFTYILYFITILEFQGPSGPFKGPNRVQKKFDISRIEPPLSMGNGVKNAADVFPTSN